MNTTCQLSGGCGAQRFVGEKSMRATGFFLILVCFLAMASSALAQETVIKGKVTDASDGRGIPGVNVYIKGTDQGTITDNDGNYQLTMPEPSRPLLFSFVGMVTQEVMVQGKSIVDIQLEEDVRQLQEVVVSALGLELDRDKVGSASTRIDGKQVAKSGEPTLINGLSGKSSGLIINRSSGDPGAGSYIQIRGQSSITGDLQPLIVVDGVPVYNSNLFSNSGGVTQQSRLNDINPSDIESIEVLKGASASALWGTRAGNGVIMITTKKGSSKGNKVNVSYSGTYSFDQILTKHPLQRTYGQGNRGFYSTGAQAGGSGNPNSFGDKIANRPGGADSVVTNQSYFVTSEGKTIYPIVESFGTRPNGGKNSRETFDQYDAIFGTGHFYDQTITLSGGNKDGNFYLSVGDLDQKGIVKNNSNYRRTSFKVNTERQMSDWVKLSSNLMYTRTLSDRAPQGNSISGILLGGLRTSPDYDNTLGYSGVFYELDPSTGKHRAVLNRQLTYRNPIGRLADPGFDNPLWSTNKEKYSSEVDRFLGSMQVEISPLDWLTATLRGSVDYYTDKRMILLPAGTAGNPNGFLQLNTISEAQYNFDGFVRGRFNLSSDLKFAALIGFNANSRSNDFSGGNINTFIVQSNPPLSLDNALAANDDPFNGLLQQRSAAGYVTADLEYKDQIFVALTGRAENSSVFSHNNNPTFFYPSATVNWHLMKTLGLQSNAISFAKVRAGYGIVSTIPTPYNTATYWDPSIYADGWGPVIKASGTLYGGGYEQSFLLGNKDIRPETKSELEFGFDLRFLQDRISLGATYFTNQVRDVIIPVSLAASTGFGQRTKNVGVIENNGIELDLSGDVIRAGDFKWNLYGNWTRIRNKVTDLGGVEVVNSNNSTAVEGHPLGVFWGGTLARESGGSYALDARGFPTLAAASSVVGDPNPEWRAGLGSVLTWKGLSLNVLFEHSQGGSMLGTTRGLLTSLGTHKDTDREVTLTATEAATINNRVGLVNAYGYPVNPDGSYTVRGYLHDFGGGPVLVDEAWWSNLGGGFVGPIESFIEPAQWTKLREVSLSYSLNSPGFRKKSRLSSIDFSVTGRNLFLWTDFLGNDPEATNLGPVNNRGRDNSTNPATRSFLFTIKINY